MNSQILIAAIAAAIVILIMQGFSQFFRNCKKKLAGIAYITDSLNNILLQTIEAKGMCTIPLLESITEAQETGNMKSLFSFLNGNAMKLLEPRSQQPISLPEEMRSLIAIDKMNILQDFERIVYMQGDRYENSNAINFIARNFCSKKKFLELDKHLQKKALTKLEYPLTAIENDQDQILTEIAYVLKPAIKKYIMRLRFLLAGRISTFSSLYRLEENLNKFSSEITPFEGFLVDEMMKLNSNIEAGGYEIA